SKKMVLIGCVDPRVDPMDVLQLEPGEAAIIRNVGGRVNPSLFETLKILATVSKAGGVEVDTAWNLVVMQHTECGINGCYHNAPELLAPYMGVPLEALDSKAITDPYKAVAIDVAALREHPVVGKNFTVSGLVYDVATGLVETVVPPDA
ncbi:MAG: carbonic anhydrase, partial [Luteibacter sp.]